MQKEIKKNKSMLSSRTRYIVHGVILICLFVFSSFAGFWFNRATGEVQNNMILSSVKLFRLYDLKSDISKLNFDISILLEFGNNESIYNARMPSVYERYESIIQAERKDYYSDQKQQVWVFEVFHALEKMRNEIDRLKMNSLWDTEDIKNQLYVLENDVNVLLDQLIRAKKKDIGALYNHSRDLIQQVTTVQWGLFALFSIVLVVSTWNSFQKIIIPIQAFTTSLQKTTGEKIHFSKVLEEKEKLVTSLGKQMSSDIHTLINSSMQMVSSLKQSQERLIIQERMAALGTLIAGVAHEINTPLGIIKSSAENIRHAQSRFVTRNFEAIRTLKEKDMKILNKLIDTGLSQTLILSSREQRQHRRRLTQNFEEKGFGEESAEFAENLVDMNVVEDLNWLLDDIDKNNFKIIMNIAFDYLTIVNNNANISASVERSGKIVYAMKKIIHKDADEKKALTDVNEGIDVVLTVYHNQLKHNIELHKEFENLPLFFAWPDELNQIWTNLLHNSLQAMDHKGTITILTKKVADQVQVHFEDNGPGIPQDIQKKIFEPFFTTKAAGEGSGMGLDICKRIAEKHGGTIELESEPGRTVFTVSLPIITEDAEMIEQNDQTLEGENV